MIDVDVVDVEKSFDQHPVLTGLSLHVASGCFTSVLGPSGSGKTTLLRVIAGFERADGGRVQLGGVVVDDEHHFVDSRERRIGYVPQEGSLFPHLSVRANVGFGLARSERRGTRVNELLEMVGLDGLATRLPHELSGGQQQRVALARALAISPALVLLDEPFSSLDASLRTSLRHDVREVLRREGTTVLLVTHDLDEALSLADHVAIVGEGKIRQVDTPTRLYANPRSVALARAMGNVNFVPGVVRGDAVETALGTLALVDGFERGELRDGTAVDVLIRPEQVVLESNDAARNAEVLSVDFYGHDAVLTLRVAALGATTLTARSPDAITLPVAHDHVGVSIRHAVMAWPSPQAPDTV